MDIVVHSRSCVCARRVMGLVGMRTIDFSCATKFGNFSDAIVLPDGVNMTEGEIEAEKERRLANWLAVIDPPPPEEGIKAEPSDN